MILMNMATIAAKPSVPPRNMWCCYHGCIKHMWQVRLSNFRSPDPSRSGVTALPVVSGRRGRKSCQWRLCITSGLPLCCGWQGTSTALGTLSHCLRVAPIYAWLWWPSKDCPSQGNWCFPYLLAISHGFHPKPGLGQLSKDCYAYA